MEVVEDMAEKLITLRGGKSFVTVYPDSMYLVREGVVLVYVAPLKQDGVMGRRYLLHEAGQGERIPSLRTVFEGQTWVLCLVALDCAVLYEQPGTMTEEAGEEFVERASITNYGEENFTEQILEEYNRNIVKEENYIYATHMERADTRRKSLRLIYALFGRKHFRRETPEAGNLLYDAMAYVCDRRKIPIAPYTKIIAAAGRRFRAEDVARVSHFILREVLLGRKWYQKDSGSLIGFLKEGHKAVALLPHGHRGYLAYHPDTHETCRIDEEFAQKLEEKACALYRPFPNQAIKPADLWKFALRETDAGDWIRFLVLALLGTFIGILLPVLNQQIYDRYIPMSYSAGIIQICLVMLACNVGSLSFTVVKNLSSFRNIRKMEGAVFAGACERLFHLPPSFFRKYEAAQLSERLLKIDTVFGLILDAAVKTFVAAVFSLLYLFQMFFYSAKMATLGLLLLLAIMAVIVLLAVRQGGYEEGLLEHDARANSHVYQFITGIQKIRMAGVEERSLLEYLRPYIKAKENHIRKEGLGNVVQMLTVAVPGIFSVVFYYQMIKNQGNPLEPSLSIGEFTAFMAAFGAFCAVMMTVSTSLMKINVMKPVLKRMKPILESLPEYEEDSELPGELTGDIEISNVDFGYTAEAGLVLRDLSVHIRSGEYVGLVGASGCGKSTLLKLLLGFEKPGSGKIYYDGKDIDKMDKRELRKKLGAVLQEGKLIAGSIFENIVITSPDATLKDAMRVADEVGLSEDITQMPMGMHTVLSEMGRTISGGQQQRILIARAIVGRPKILFFDEATSALDNRTQAMVCESLAKLKATRLVIAHRLSTIQDCDRILVLDKGRIVEEGNYESLMKRKGLFYDLATRQMA